ncbi:MAG: hypothetical protein RIS47_1549, partial [Bacteroidota bacterium]
ELIYHVILKYISPGILLGIAFYFGLSYVFGSPTERSLRRENELLKLNYELMNQKYDDAEKVLAELNDRDDHIYRAIFGTKPIASAIRQAGMGGNDRYADLKQFEWSELAISTTQRVDRLAKQIVIQSKSFDEVEQLALNKVKMLASIPAIQPIPNKDLNHRPYGYGSRIDPVYKTPAFHEGMDFSAPVGTPIYATGDGKVLQADSESRGYGKHVKISHGYGYVTLYGHMSKIIAKPGQKVKRGDIIGLVGSTGKSVGPHLHYEVRINDQPVNPVYFYYDDLSAKEYDKMIEISNSVGQSLD